MDMYPMAGIPFTDKQVFDDKMAVIHGQLEVATQGTSGVHAQYEEYKEREKELNNKVVWFC